MAEKLTTTEFRRLAPHEQIAALAYAGNAYGLADLCGVHSTHRESDLWQRLNEAGFEIVRADDQGRAVPSPTDDQVLIALVGGAADPEVDALVDSLIDEEGTTRG